MILVNLEEHLFHTGPHEFPVHFGVLIPPNSFCKSPILCEVSGQIGGIQESKECLEIIPQGDCDFWFMIVVFVDIGMLNMKLLCQRFMRVGLDTQSLLHR